MKKKQMISKQESNEIFEKVYFGKLIPKEGKSMENVLEDIKKMLDDPSLRNGYSEETIQLAYKLVKQVVEKNKAKAPV